MSHFNQNAATWDTPQKIQMMTTLAAQTQTALAHLLTGNKDIDIIDFGCGTGLFGLEFAAHARTLIGIDSARGMLDVFEQKTTQQKDVRAVHADFETITADEISKLNLSAHLILSCMAFHHLKKPEEMIIKLSGLLGPGGHLAIVDLDKEDGTCHPNNTDMGVHHFGFDENAVLNWGAAGGFKVERRIIHNMVGDDKTFPIFLATFSKP